MGRGERGNYAGRGGIHEERKGRMKGECKEVRVKSKSRWWKGKEGRGEGARLETGGIDEERGGEGRGK